MTLLPLFPLGSVLFPGGVLRLRVFEARYLDLVTRCLREATPFGVVCLRQGSELRDDKQAVLLEDIGTLAHLQDVDADQAGILSVRCIGGMRFRVHEAAQRADGLWLATPEWQAADERVAPMPELAQAATALSTAIESLDQKGQQPFARPYRLDDAGWVANRWCEILPIAPAARQRLMQLDEPQLRLRLVHDFLRGKGVL